MLYMYTYETCFLNLLMATAGGEGCRDLGVLYQIADQNVKDYYLRTMPYEPL